MPAPVTDDFLNRQTELVSWAAQLSDSLRNTDHRPWMVPEPDTDSGWLGDLTDQKSVGYAFPRDEINDGVAKAAQGLPFDPSDPTSVGERPASLGDGMSLCLQGDVVAMLERAFRLRHASYPRCVAWAAARRAGHGNADQGVFARLKNRVQDLITAGSTDDFVDDGEDDGGEDD